MRGISAVSVSFVLMFGCGRTQPEGGGPDGGSGAGSPPASDAGSGSGGNGPGSTPDGGVAPPQQHTLRAHVTGDGEVRASAFSCRASCDLTLQSTQDAHLTAVPDSDWKFDGWQGDCTGTGACDLAMSGDHDVTAAFSKLPPPPPGTVTVTVKLVGDGSGRVKDPSVMTHPTGGVLYIYCPSACTETVTAGTRVTLTATADAGSSFAGWGGGCSGGGDCNLNVTADITVWANFAANPPPPPPVNSCANISGPDALPMLQHVAQPTRYVTCLSGNGDGNGTLSFPMSYDASDSHGSLIDFVREFGRVFLQESYFSAESPNPIQEIAGLAAAGSAPHMWPYGPVVTLGRWDSSGNLLGIRFEAARQFAAAADPGAEGLLLAGDLSDDAYNTNPSLQHQAMMWSDNGIHTGMYLQRWVRPLASPGPVFGAGVDLVGRSLVITGGPSAGVISGQWFDRDGTALTGAFALLAGFVPGSSTWFETSPLIGGGLEVRRMDYQAGLHAQALVLVASGAAQVSDAPKWMKDRPDTRLQITRGGKAYAALPYGKNGGACTERLEIVAPDGTSCGTRDYPIAASTCNTMGLTLSADGTVMQQLPSAMESILSPTFMNHTCTWRWWAQAAH